MTSENLQLALLADRPEALRSVARWHYETWAKGDDPDATVERVAAKIAAYLRRQGPPLLVLALRGTRAVGCAQLKFREMDLYPDYEHWIGGIYVEPEERGHGIASRLVQDLLRRAREAGIERLYLQTEDLSGGLYAAQGFQPLEEVDYHGYRALVMVKDLET